MLKLLLASFLLLLSVAPNGSAKTNLENRIKELIDQPNITVEQKNSVITPNTVEMASDFKDKTTDARAVYFLDIKTGQELITKNSEQKLPIASLTKLMTALVVIEDNNLNEIVTVSRLNTRGGDALMGLQTGDKVAVIDLLNGLLINSGSDSALALSNHISGGESEFVSQMNQKAKILGLKSTHFTNPVGWDESGNYSTAHDMAILTKVALTNPTIAEIVQKPSATVYSTGGRPYLLKNTNQLLDRNHYLGAKTGTTYNAGECLAIYFKDTDKELVGVILNSPGRFTETKDIINWIDKSYLF
jgi:D-alanyl-D-alanine carboxypeptidase